MKKWIILLAIVLPLGLVGQTIQGNIGNNNGEPLIGAYVYWLEKNIQTATDEAGQFTIEAVENGRLVASYIGYQADTLNVKPNTSTVTFTLREDNVLEAVVVQGKQDAILISNINPIKTQQITQTSLKQAACCDLAGCFGGQSSVQPHTTNVITNSKELRILGLSGVYNQVLISGLPMIRGLSYTYGISSIPGTMVDNIYISMGANSVLQGYESISGQVNVETKKPRNTDRLLFNAYLNSFMEKQVNLNYSFKTGDWHSLAAFHAVQPADRIDRDADNFLDVPLLTRYSFTNTWNYGNPNEWGWNSQIGVRWLNEERIGGQTNFTAEDRGSTSVYGQHVQLNQPELWTKTGFRWDDIHNLTVSLSGFQQRQDAYFGVVHYDAQQTSLYAKAQYEYTYAERQVLKTGLSFRYLDLQETIGLENDVLNRTYAGNYQQREIIPGFFAENTLFLLDDKLTWLAGIRGDHHNDFGFQLTPRTLLKYNLSERTVLRANVGFGWRTVNLFSENIGLFASSRDLIIADDLAPEKAWNYGVNLTRKFGEDKLSGYLSLDYYRTDFSNQIFPDYDTDPGKAFVRNFTGESVSNGLQAELLLNFGPSLSWKNGFTYLDVYQVVEGEKNPLPFTARYHLLSNLNWQPTAKNYHLDLNVHWYGKQRLPNTTSNPADFQRPDFSTPYAVVNAQFTYNFKRMEWYAGVENIFDFRQRQPILSWENPFGPHFDTATVWGPTRGREFYVGVRYTLEKATE
ncbi:MAG: TonB-dependent receptor [Bacteroidota bacterium]